MAARFRISWVGTIVAAGCASIKWGGATPSSILPVPIARSGSTLGLQGFALGAQALNLIYASMDHHAVEMP